jgi:hypothetical protein
MKKLIPVVIVLALVVVGLGFYRGWFTLSSPDSDKANHKVNVNLTMDGDKFQEDARTVKNKATELTGKATEQIQGTSGQAKDGK